MFTEQPLLTRAQAAKLLHVTTRTIMRHEERGVLRSVRIGSRVLIPRAEIERALTPHRPGAA